MIGPADPCGKRGGARCFLEVVRAGDEGERASEINDVRMGCRGPQQRLFFELAQQPLDIAAGSQGDLQNQVRPAFL
ncbi:MAG: hypothetical protein K6U89_05175 [Chloroflexi bacterium]|nr:hypothetical protein [Chloroflexota bacterium]GIW11029.1 MAG: hypothetical protein KatS3mg061_2086 [Dehalococcoidia bacterium]